MKQNQPTGWVGWVYFAGVMMMIVGSLHALAGLVALFKDDFYVATTRALLVFNYTAWGWVHLLLGLLVLAAGVAVTVGSTWGRVVGVILAIFSAIANLTFISAYPIWSITALVIDFFVIYALTMHGAEVKD